MKSKSEYYRICSEIINQIGLDQSDISIRIIDKNNKSFRSKLICEINEFTDKAFYKIDIRYNFSEVKDFDILNKDTMDILNISNTNDIQFILTFIKELGHIYKRVYFEKVLTITNEIQNEITKLNIKLVQDGARNKRKALNYMSYDDLYANNFMLNNIYKIINRLRNKKLIE